MRKRIELLYGRPPLFSNNTEILSGIPMTEVEMERLERSERLQKLRRLMTASASDLPDDLAAEQDRSWDLWHHVGEKWNNLLRRHALRPLEPSQHSTGSDFLEALQSKQNVIVLIAHADSDCIYFSNPPLDGSKVGPREIRSLREQIAHNKPVVYLFCCGTAHYVGDSIRSISEVLLECGVAAVVAPQEKIQDARSRRLFEEFLKFSRQSGPLVALRNAETASNNRDMEAWLG